MGAAVTTLLEAGRYEEGLAALLNSLVAAGFQGRVWCGIRGEVPAWLAPAEVKRRVGDDIEIRTVSPATTRHLSYHKADFIRLVGESEPEADSLVYLDPDIVVKCEWSFVERWASSGIAVVADMKAPMPRSSPIRKDWLALCETLGVTVPQSTTPLDMYCNAGFVGLSRDCYGFLELWSALIHAALAGRDNPRRAVESRPGRDQDLFNIALMGWADRASVMGPDAMDYIGGGDALSHANMRPSKPWDGGFIRSALLGRPPGRADRQYLRYRGGPFDPPARGKMRRQMLSYKIARAIGTVVKRPEN
jgi:hypothetical protein